MGRINPWFEEAIKRVEAKRATPTGLPVVIEVEPGKADEVASQLRALGYTVEGTVSDFVFADLPEPADVEKVAKLPGVKLVSAQKKLYPMALGVDEIFKRVALATDPILSQLNVSDLYALGVKVKPTAEIPTPFGALVTMVNEALKFAQNPFAKLADYIKGFPPVIARADWKLVTDTKKLMEAPDDNTISIPVGVIDTGARPGPGIGFPFIDYACDSLTIEPPIDSVPGYSPVVIKQDGYLDVVSFEDLWESINAPLTLTPRGEEVKDVSNLDLKVLSSRGRFVKVNQIIRHWYKGKLMRIRAIGGVTDVTPSHSLFGADRRKPIEASKLRPGDKIAVVNKGWRCRCVEEELFVGAEDLGWLYGFFLAEGFVTKRSDGAYLICITNTDEALVEKTKKILEKELNLNPYITTRKYGNGKLCYVINVNNKRAYDFFKNTFYTKRGYKKVPTSIFNSPPNVVKAFLEGFIAGDGHVLPDGEVQVDSSSWLILQSILTLHKKLNPNLSFVVGITKSGFTNKDELRLIIRNNSNKQHNWYKDRGLVEIVKEIEYEGYVYDFSTENQKFIAGCGGITHHNTMSHGSWVGSCAFGRPAPTRYGNFEPVSQGYTYHVKVFTAFGPCSSYQIMKAMEMCAEKGCRVVNMSLGGPLEGSVDEDPECVLAEKLYKQYGTNFIVAAGNDGEDWSINSPGASPYVLCVAAMDWKTMDTSSYSSRGPQAKWYVDHKDAFDRDHAKYGEAFLKPDVAGIGGDRNSQIVAACSLWYDGLYDFLPDGFDLMIGTSMATPHCAGVVALAIDRGLINNVDDVKARMRRFGEKSADKGYGLLTWSKLRG